MKKSGQQNRGSNNRRERWRITRAEEALNKEPEINWNYWRASAWKENIEKVRDVCRTKVKEHWTEN